MERGQKRSQGDKPGREVREYLHKKRGGPEAPDGMPLKDNVACGRWLVSRLERHTTEFLQTGTDRGVCGIRLGMENAPDGATSAMWKYCLA